jgi:hypothetical protein
MTPFSENLKKTYEDIVGKSGSRERRGIESVQSVSILYDPRLQIVIVNNSPSVSLPTDGLFVVYTKMVIFPPYSIKLLCSYEL